MGRPAKKSSDRARPKSLRIRRDDAVIVISGKHKGRSGRVVRTEPARQRVFVEGVNMIKRHTRPRSVRDTQRADSGGIVEQEGPIHVSNVMLLDPKDNKPTRVGMRVGESGRRQRFSKRTGNAID